MPSTDARAPFERLSREPARAYHGFCHYRDLPISQRSLDAAWRQHSAQCAGKVQPVTRRRPMSWGDWSVQYRWVDRVSAFDSHLERQKRAALEAEQVEAGRRHARVLQAAISTVTLPLRVALEVAATPTGMETLTNAARANLSGLRLAIAEARLAAAHLPQLVQAERLVLGMTTDAHEVREAPPLYDPVAALIVRDPAAMELALELLNRAAKPISEE